MHCTKNEISSEDFFSKCDQIHSFLWIWLHLLKKFLMKNFIFSVVWDPEDLIFPPSWGQVGFSPDSPHLPQIPLNLLSLLWINCMVLTLFFSALGRGVAIYLLLYNKEFINFLVWSDLQRKIIDFQNKTNIFFQLISDRFAHQTKYHNKRILIIDYSIPWDLKLKTDIVIFQHVSTRLFLLF